MSAVAIDTRFFNAYTSLCMYALRRTRLSHKPEIGT